MLITESVPASSLGDLGRLDAWYFLSPGAAAARRLDKAKAAGLQSELVGGFADVWAPARFRRVYAADGEAHIGYLRPHDIFRYLPVEVDRLSLKRSKKLENYRVKRGMILQTCSGRNLGPSVIVDRHTAQFALSHDLVRIEVDDARMRHYLSAFMQSKTGQGLLRRDKSGSVIDHITVEHVKAQELPLLDDSDIDRAAELIGKSFALIEEARDELTTALVDYENALPSPDRPSPLRAGWSITSGQLQDRLDSASYDPWVAQIRKELLSAGGVPVAEVADVRKPPGRYKTYYVGADYGIPFLSGTQILQFEVINQRYMASKTFTDPELYKLRAGWSVYQADGRAEEALGLPAFVPEDRAGWAASGHVGRLVPKNGTNPGWLWLAASTWQVQVQIKSLASGSVVDSTYPADMERVIIPPALDVDGTAIEAAWAKFTQARHLKSQATQLIDDAMAALSGVDDEELEIDELQDANQAIGEGIEADEPGEDAVAEESGDEPV